jgi:diguanylate cyclase (GGDEF)-like protein
MKNYKFYVLALFFAVFIIYTSFEYMDYVEVRKNNYQEVIYAKEAEKMQKGVLELIRTKEKATVGIALGLAKDSALKGYLQIKKVPLNYYKNMVQEYKKSTDYKNIWIQILDKDLNSLYRSWTSARNDNLLNSRKDLVTALDSKKVVVGISSGKYDLSMSAIIPILKNGKILGLLEVTSHFNSIAQQMKRFDTNSVVLLDLKNTKRLKEPFTNMFLDHHYIANFNAPLNILIDMKKYGVANYTDNKSPYEIANGYLITSFKLRCVHGKEIGDYIMFKKLSDISSIGTEFLFFKELTFGVLVLVFIIGIITLVMFFYIRKQKLYYKNIINSTSDIILVNNKRKLIDVNKAFYKYFKNYTSFHEFVKKHTCICSFFEKEEGYLQENMDKLYWIDYLMQQDENESSVVKLKIESKIYYFKVSASTIMDSLYMCSIVFSDITKQETYKHSLEVLTTTDPLTEIGNRRFYEQKLQEEMVRADRYKHPLSLIMFDIDFFKKVNDTYGHDAGDVVLKEYSALIKSMIRTEDIFCRIGGEEFMLILPDTDIKSSHAIAEKLRKAVEEFDSKIQVTMSFGLVQYEKNEKSHEIYKRVDNALYEAKNSGRNRVVVG